MYHSYPYTDFHEANMDWFLNRFKSLLQEWAEMQVRFDNLQEAFEALRTFVNDYFDNLDVQVEINNKLDDMANDGSLTALIAPFVNDISYPIPVNSVSDMTQTDKLYLLTDNLHVYYYNGTNFVDTGVLFGSNELAFTPMSGTYNASSLPDMNDAVPNRYYIISNIAGIANIPADLDDGTTHTGNLISFSIGTGLRFGTIQIYITREPFRVYERGYFNSWTPWRVIDDRKHSFLSPDTTYTNIDADTITNTGVYVYSYSSDETNTPGSYGGFLVNYVDNSYGFTLQIYYNTINETYIRRKWGSPLAWSDWYLLDDRFTFKSHAGLSASGSIDDFNNLTPNSFYAISAPHTALNSPPHTLGGLCITYSVTTTLGLGYEQIWIETGVAKTPRMYHRTYWGSPAGWSEWRLLNNTAFLDNIFCGFNSFGVIGDSLGCGTCAYHTSTNSVAFTQIESVSWPSFLSKRTGMVYQNFSVSGTTVKGWLNSAKRTECFDGNHDVNCYIVGLAVNDGTQQTSIGVLGDIKSDYNQNGDTYYGNYGKILQLINEHNPKCKIFCLETPHHYEAYNAAVKDICDNCTYVDNAYFIELADYSYNYYNSEFPVINDSMRGAGHFNAIAYSQMADIIKRALSEYMSENIIEFNQIEFIDTNFSW